MLAFENVRMINRRDSSVANTLWRNLKYEIYALSFFPTEQKQNKASLNIGAGFIAAQLSAPSWPTCAPIRGLKCVCRFFSSTCFCVMKKRK